MMELPFSKQHIALLLVIVIVISAALSLTLIQFPLDENGNNTNNTNNPNGPNTEYTYYTLITSTQGEGTITRSPLGQKVIEGAQVVLTATPQQGWYFNKWIGDLNSTENPLTFTIDKNITVQAVFSKGSYHLDLDIEGVGRLFINNQLYDTENAYFQAGETIEIYAQERNGYVFTHWEGDLTGDTNPIQINITENISATAVFETGFYRLTVETEGNGIVTKQPNKNLYEAGDTVTLTAKGDTGWGFTQWSGNGYHGKTDNPYTITITQHSTITAEFELLEYSLIVHSSGNGTYTKDPEQTSYNYGDEVELTANPDTDDGWIFNYWENELTGTRFSENPHVFTITGNLNVSLNFTKSGYYLSIYTEPDEAEGTYTRQPDQNIYFPDQEVSITAKGINGWSFANWTGAVTSTSPTIEIVMDENKTLTANYLEQGLLLNITTKGQGEVIVSPEQGSYTNGTNITLTAQPSTKWIFSGWSGDISSTENPYTFTITNHTNITATFKKITYNLTVLIEGNGTVSPGNGTYTVGSTITLRNTADEDYSFNYWQNNSETSRSSTYTFKITEDTTITAHFCKPQDKYTLNLETTGGGNINLDPAKNYYEPSEIIDLDAQPNSGKAFSHWEGDINGTGPAYTLVIQQNTSVIAVFVEGNTLTLNKEGQGSLYPPVGEHNYPVGTNITVTATPQTGWYFDNWTGDITDTTPTLHLTMDQDYSITAHFLRHEYPIAIKLTGNGNVKINGQTYDPDQDYLFPYGTELTLQAIPKGGSQFTQWTGDVHSTNQTITIIMDSQKNLEATFVTPDLDVVGSISLTDVTPDSTIYGSFAVINKGDEDSLLSWHSEIDGTGGVYILSPSSTIGQGADVNDAITVNVTIIVPDMQETTFYANITIENSYNSSDFDVVPIIITTDYEPATLWERIIAFIQDIISQSPFLERILAMMPRLTEILLSS